jgi:hypothetical protein
LGVAEGRLILNIDSLSPTEPVSVQKKNFHSQLQTLRYNELRQKSYRRTPSLLELQSFTIKTLPISAKKVLLVPVLNALKYSQSSLSYMLIALLNIFHVPKSWGLLNCN